MNKPESLKFEYEELRNKHNEVVAYRLTSNKNYVEWHDIITSEVSDFLCADKMNEVVLLTEDFEPFKQAVHEYNQKYCKQPEIDTSILDGFEKWCEENHYTRYCRSSMQELFSEFKAPLKPQYFFEKE